jgi:ABC-type antimicrobial peptide transport system permease subunit
MATSPRTTPPRLALKFFRWYCRERLVDHIEGDLIEAYQQDLKQSGKKKADLKFFLEVLMLFRPGIVKSAKGEIKINQYAMYKSYFKIGWRNLIKERGYSFINIGGLALGIAIAFLIGLWVYDELSHNKHHEHYNSIALVLQHNTFEGNIDTYSNQSYQLGAELRSSYGSYFEHVVMSYPKSSILSNREKAFTLTGSFMEPGAPELLSLKMLHGSRTGLEDVSSIMLSASTANALFGLGDATGKMLKLDASIELKVIGVYENMPNNSDFKNDLDFIAPLEIEITRGNRSLGWGNNWLQVLVQLAENVELQQASLAIKDAKMRNVTDYDKRFNAELFLHPMAKWHLYSDFKNGVNIGGHIDFVWLFGSIGLFVLLLACINFMNLSTARSQKRSREVGVRKVIGSARGQLIRQFFSESLLVVFLAFAVGLLLVQILLPAFNQIAGKNIYIDWLNPTLWLVSIGFIILTALVAGSYPAFYLSGFSPINVLKGPLRLGRFASLPRKVLVVVQFSVSVILVIGTIVVYQQIEFAKNRPIGYDMKGLVTIPIKTEEVKNSYEAFKNELLASRMASVVSTSETTVANMWWSDWGFKWKGKDPNMQDNIYRGAVDYEFGKTIEWKIKQGRDFSREFPSDSSAMILNEAAVHYMKFDDPIGEIIEAYGRKYTVIGVVEDMVTQSLYHPAGQTVFLLDPFDRASFINIRIDPQASAGEALATLRNIFSKHNPSTPFEYFFTDDEFSDKFAFESRVGKLVGIFSVLAIFISCLGLFGLASFVAEQRTKEIGIRKVMGASVPALWQALTKDFVLLIVIACFIAIPLGYYLMNGWLMQYAYRTGVSGWVLLVTAAGALGITLLTVSFQALKAAFTSPVNSLRSE